MSVKSHLTYGASVRPENAVTYSAGNEGQKICGVFSETAPLQRSSTPSVVRPCVQSAIFPCVFLVYAHAYFSCIYAHDTPPRVQHFSAFHWVCVCVCLSVCLLSHISPMERLFVLKTLSRTQRATKVKKFVGFSLKPLRCRDPALPPLYGHAYSRPFFSCTRMRISRVYTRMIHRRGFSTLVLFIIIVTHFYFFPINDFLTTMAH